MAAPLVIEEDGAFLWHCGYRIVSIFPGLPGLIGLRVSVVCVISVAWGDSLLGCLKLAWPDDS